MEAGVPAQSSGRRASQDSASKDATDTGAAVMEEGAEGAGEATGGGPWATLRCVFCRLQLAAANTAGTPRLMECLHSVCEACITAKLLERSQARDYNGEVNFNTNCTFHCQTCLSNSLPGSAHFFFNYYLQQFLHFERAREQETLRQ